MIGLLLGSSMLMAQNDALPPELSRAFDRYSRAWRDRDWSTAFDVQSPAAQQEMIKKFGSKDAWMKLFDKEFKDVITALERGRVYRMQDQLYTIKIMTKGYHVNKEEFVIHNYVTFQWDGRGWCLVETVYPTEKTN